MLIINILKLPFLLTFAEVQGSFTAESEDGKVSWFATAELVKFYFDTLGDEHTDGFLWLDHGTVQRLAKAGLTYVNLIGPFYYGIKKMMFH